MKANEKWWFWVLVIVLAMLTPIMNHFIGFGFFISLLVIIIALNATRELRQDFKEHWNRYRKLNIISLIIILLSLIVYIYLFIWF
jgi:hypothetical protein